MNRSDHILDELKGISPLLAEVGAKNLFFVPDDYFITLADIVTVCLKNREYTEHTEVPANYFNDLPGKILSKIEGTAARELQELSPLLAGMAKETPYEVPDGYFNALKPQQGLSPLEDYLPAILANAKRNQPFDVPAGYFETLSAHILQKTRQPSVTSSPAALIRRIGFMKYAAAAVVTGILALGIYKFANNEIVQSSAAVEIGKNMNDSKFDEMLGNLEEEEIVKYLEKNGSDADLAAVTSGIEESSLPDREEYIMDESTLDKFIEDVNFTN